MRAVEGCSKHLAILRKEEPAFDEVDVYSYYVFVICASKLLSVLFPNLLRSIPDLACRVVGVSILLIAKCTLQGLTLWPFIVEVDSQLKVAAFDKLDLEIVSISLLQWLIGIN